MSNTLRIIGGEWRSRVITFKDAADLRPTPVRVRETLFNWLRNDIVGSQCLDLFAGSGALGFEAVSRGAKHVVLVDANPDTCRELQANQVKLKTDAIEIVNQDGLAYLRQSRHRFDVVFVDPPFRDNYAGLACSALAESDVIAVSGIVYVETAADCVFTPPERWALLKQKTAGDVRYNLFSNGPGHS
ncbi:MAG: 16S rRNA (guanine(966)-N(2))-methyltransferase RsmD [Methylomonas sp.]|nr:MAG: 16S rRNA (guanine(966)-N(2))-methyltransferase RsmD [Methylomonas sp.]PPD24673.1 MAG: 16S rRNA (guanine(966)-N(2))-methyltransferase RsmD [Methylomonas sp.]PPD33222.1 MAG: 16S rRNA (guanine(966)-N(2))-methyltransferase RsmD [Methylomonas sp.]PPD41682.1 MAG: 16S rRNA (guanine(966)-N(2))-methyltransferase RsmD [Methylomonas sp.]PPD54538.1 MAG: 16S rRNA (guanine(966)-N(2))-methyltransferase RsmD [Methylomonas sp.]